MQHKNQIRQDKDSRKFKILLRARIMEKEAALEALISRQTTDFNGHTLKVLYSFTGTTVSIGGLAVH